MRHSKWAARARLLCSAAIVAMAMPAAAQAVERTTFDIKPQGLATALNEFGAQSGHTVLVSSGLTFSKTTRGFNQEADPDTALRSLLAGTGLTYTREGDVFAIIARNEAPVRRAPQPVIAAETVSGSAVEGLVVTAQKRRENIQDVPIAISAFTQDELTLTQIAGGPDLMTQIPNLTFTKTNFSGYSIQIRGIGTQAISATTDAAVAVALNNTSLIRNRFFEQEFYDLERIEVLRGPQGTLYGRNATAGVVNILTAKPSFESESKGSIDLGNYGSRRLEAMVNMPLAEDKAALRFAGAWTKREGYTTNQLTGNSIDGRDLWSTRLSLRLAPTDTISANLIWEHFEEDDDRLRSGKQLCKKDVPPLELGGVPMQQGGGAFGSNTYLTQGCLPVSLYSPEAFQTPNGYSLPYFGPTGNVGNPIVDELDPYLSGTQSQDLRVIESAFEPEYRAQTDIAQIILDFDVAEGLTLASDTTYATDSLFSSQDFNRFSARPGVFQQTASSREGVLNNGVFCDPQVGCSDRLVLADLSTAQSQHFSQEFRLSSNFDGPFNFSLGANFLRYDTEDKYYVFVNSLTLFAAGGSYGANDYPYVGGVSDNSECILNRTPGDPDAVQALNGCIYIDPNPIDKLNDLGHNYFLSRNPYRLISYAGFGEAYYNLTPNLKLTAGLRWTVDKKHAPRIPSWLLVANYPMTGSFGYPVMEVVKQDWSEPTGRLAIDWKPEFAFTDSTLVYASYARGYKAGGMNPPPAVLALYGGISGLKESLVQPKTFEAEFVDSFEVGTKNTLLDGALTLNTSAFYYDYQNYQLSQIINRSAVTQNFDAKIWGVELEADWRLFENFRLGFKGGFEDTRVGDGEQAIDLMDRTAGHSDWAVIRPFPTVPSNCILPVSYLEFVNVALDGILGGNIGIGPHGHGACATAYLEGFDPYTGTTYVPYPSGPGGYPGFDPDSAPNNGEGFFKDLSGNELPNAPRFTTTLTADYTIPVTENWLLSLHADYYRQSKAWTRIFNFDPYDRLKPYENVNLAALLTNDEGGWTVMAYVKNVFDNDAITGAFLNSDDTGLTTNVFLLEPRLYGVRITKQWVGTPISRGAEPAKEHTPGAPYLFTMELGGAVQRSDAQNAAMTPDFLDAFPPGLDPRSAQREDLDWGDGRDIKLTYQPDDSAWKVSAGLRFGRANGTTKLFAEEIGPAGYLRGAGNPDDLLQKYNYVTTNSARRENHTLIDFAVGREIGLGAFGGGGKSTIGVGVRHAKFKSSSYVETSGIPDYYLAAEYALQHPIHHTQYKSNSSANRSFKGTGPVLSWDASKRLLGDAASHADLEWAIGGGVLFGKQKVFVSETASSVYTSGSTKYPPTDLPPKNISRSKSVSVPIFDASLGLSYTLERVKVGAGYRWERYFDVLDGGYADRKSYDRTIDGPYVKIAIGFGG